MEEHLFYEILEEIGESFSHVICSEGTGVR